MTISVGPWLMMFPANLLKLSPCRSVLNSGFQRARRWWGRAEAKKICCRVDKEVEEGGSMEGKMGASCARGAAGRYWEAVILKFMKVVEKWSRVNLGLHWRTRVYNMFAISILQFYLQFYQVSEDLRQAEKGVMQGIQRPR